MSEQFDWLAPSKAAEKLKSIRLSSMRVAEQLEATTVRNKQCKYDSRFAACGEICLVKNGFSLFPAIAHMTCEILEAVPYLLRSQIFLLI